MERLDGLEQEGKEIVSTATGILKSSDDKAESNKRDAVMHDETAQNKRGREGDSILN